MQGPWELGRDPGQMHPLSGSPSDLTEEAGEVYLHEAIEGSSANEAPGRQSSARVQWVRTHSHLPLSDEEAWISRLSEDFSTCIAGGLDPGEHNGAWGEFEGFRESSAKSEQFSRPFELPERPTAPQPPRTTSAQKECGSHQLHQGGPWVTGTTVISPSESVLSYENIFRFAFQEVPVQQAPEDVFTLDHFAEMSSEEKPGLGSGHKWCSESRKFWRALQNADSMSTSRCLWSGSRCQENFFLSLGVDAAQNLSGSQGHVLESSELKEPEEVGMHSFGPHHCRALTQTKLAGTPGGRQGDLVTYSLSLRNPSHRSGRCVPAPRRRRVFSSRDLKVTLFRSDVC